MSFVLSHSLNQGSNSTSSIDVRSGISADSAACLWLCRLMVREQSGMDMSRKWGEPDDSWQTRHRSFVNSVPVLPSQRPTRFLIQSISPVPWAQMSLIPYRCISVSPFLAIWIVMKTIHLGYRSARPIDNSTCLHILCKLKLPREMEPNDWISYSLYHSTSLGSTHCGFDFRSLTLSV